MARKSVLWAIGTIGVFYLFTLALGFGAAALVGVKAITAQDKAGNTAAPQLAQELGRRYLGGETGGSVITAVIAAVAFATILAVVAGLTLASSSSVAHDFYASVSRRGNAAERDEVKVARTGSRCPTPASSRSRSASSAAGSARGSRRRTTPRNSPSSRSAA